MDQNDPQAGVMNYDLENIRMKRAADNQKSLAASSVPDQSEYDDDDSEDEEKVIGNEMDIEGEDDQLLDLESSPVKKSKSKKSNAKSSVSKATKVKKSNETDTSSLVTVRSFTIDFKVLLYEGFQFFENKMRIQTQFAT